MQKPLVSISLLAFNSEMYIRAAIEGCLMQKVDFDYEIIIHDDASMDNTPQIIKEYANKYPGKIIPILQTENQFSKGTEINTKIVIPKARGKYIAFLDADDYWIDPLKLEYQIGVLESNPDVSMCFTASKHIFPLSSKEPRVKRYRNYDSACSIKDVILKGGRLVDMGSAVVRRTVFEDVPEWYYYYQIWDISIPLLSLSYGKIYYLDKVTLIFRYNAPGSWTQNNVKNYERRKNNLKKSIKLTDGFNEATNYKFHRYIEKKHDSMIVEVLLLSNTHDEDFLNLYSRLPLIKKLEYQVFNLLGSFRLWERYRQINRLLTGY